MEPGYRILEHTADIGIESWGPSVEAAFEQAGAGLAEILGAQADRATGVETVAASAEDCEALLVDFLNELVLLHETKEVALAHIHVTQMTGTELQARVGTAPLAGETETTGVKAATYHRLEVRDGPEGVRARVYLDV